MHTPAQPGRLARRLLALGLGMVGAAGVAATEPAAPNMLFHGGSHDMLYGLAMEGRNGLAVGDFGLVVETGDGGKSWTRQAKAPTGIGLLAVARKAGHCIAAGQQGQIFTADDCRQWRAALPATKARILSVALNDSGVAYAVGGFGTLLKSSDWGRSWQTLNLDWKSYSDDGADPHLYDVHVAANGEVTLVGEFEIVLRSRDGGATWRQLHRGKRSLFGLTVLENGDAYAVGQEGLILKAGGNAGAWRELVSGTRSILTGIAGRADGRVVASGIYTILYSADGGASWQMDQSRPALAGWHQAAAIGEGSDGKPSIVLVGSGGAILSVKR
jgi:photosystem II stability/assembly factor-like uncharacterized protein